MDNMRAIELLNWSFFFILTVPLGILSCQECADCGTATAEPVINFRFFNIDSLNKVEDTLTILEDSLGKVIEGIDTGNTDLDTIRTDLEVQVEAYDQVRTDIKNGKLKIDVVYGPNGEGPIYFRDSVTNDSLTTFPFPLDMNNDSCSFIIKISDKEDQVSVRYDREMDYASERIIMRVYDLEVVESSYDSAKIICDKNRCNSNETKIYFYF
jgi:hypothetical protein